MKKQTATLMMGMVVTFGIQFVQLDGSAQMPLNFATSRAAAGFDVGKIVDKVKGQVDKIGGKGTTEALISMALGVDVHEMTDRRQNMIKNLSYAAFYTKSATYDLSVALSMKPQTIAQQEAAMRGLQSHPNSPDFIRASMNKNLDAAELKAAAERALAENDPDRIKKLTSSLQNSKKNRQIATAYKVLAFRDAMMIVRDSAKAFIGAKGQDDRLKVIADCAAVAEMSKSFVGMIDSENKALDIALAELERQRNVKPLSESEVKQQMDKIGRQ